MLYIALNSTFFPYTPYLSMRLPYKTYTLTTKLSPDVLLHRLKAAVRPKPGFSFKFTASTDDLPDMPDVPPGTKPYQGTIEGNTFTIERVISYRNSFLPQIEGNIEKDFAGTHIHITMSPPMLATMFMAVWFAVVLLACILLPVLESNQSDSIPLSFLPAIIPYAMLIFGIVMVVFGFGIESTKSWKELKMMFEAEEVA